MAKQLSRSVKKTPPGPAWYTSIQNTKNFQQDPPQFLFDLMKQYGDVVKFPTILGTIYAINHPEGVKRVLQDNHFNYSKDTSIYHLLGLVLGKGLLTNDGQSWLHQRRLIQPAFHRQRLTAFGSLMTDTTLIYLEHWDTRNQEISTLDMSHEMASLTLNIVGQALFGIDLSAESNRIGQALNIANRWVSEAFYNPLLPLRLPTAQNRQFHEATITLNTVVDEIIAERRQSKKETNDLLSMLLQARDEETGMGMDDQQVRSEVITLLLAGHETTANALTWTWFLLAHNPQIEQRLSAELASTLNGRVPTIDDLPQLTYTKMVIEESMRLYPPAWAVDRKAIADDEIGGYHIPKNSILLVSPYVTHRHPTFWEQAEHFDPERFTPESSAKRSRYTYFPFGGGPRLCIGSNFAMMEAQLILATILQRYHFRMNTEAAIQTEALVTLRPRSGMPMTLLPQTT